MQQNGGTSRTNLLIELYDRLMNRATPPAVILLRVAGLYRGLPAGVGVAALAGVADNIELLDYERCTSLIGQLQFRFDFLDIHIHDVNVIPTCDRYRK